MKNLYESLPDVVHADGRDFPITTDFRDWLKFDAMLSDDELSEVEQLQLMLAFYEPDEEGRPAFPPSLEEAINGLVWFYRCGKEQGQEKGSSGGNSDPVYDFTEDAPLIYSGFRQAYGIDLHHDDLHWWTFCSLIEGMPESTRFMQIVSIRAKDTTGMGAKEREFYEKMKRMVALGKKNKPKAMTLEERNRELISRVRRKQAKVREVPALRDSSESE